MKRRADLKILEIGQFCLIKRNLPDQTDLIFTGADFAEVAGTDYQTFTPAMLPGLVRDLAQGRWDLVCCYPPARPAWDRSHGFVRALRGLRRHLMDFRTLGTYLLHARATPPLVMLDYNDEPTIPGHIFPLLDRCCVYFKRELPADHAKAFLDASAAHRTHRDVMSSPFVARNLDKLRPVPIAVPEATTRLALATGPDKTTDVFFAGSINSTVRTAGLAQLELLRAAGHAVDLCEGGLTMEDYLARCARAWLTWSPEGYGWDCFRHYEASLCGSVPVMNQPGIFRYRPLLERAHAVYYPVEGNGLRDALANALADKPTLAAMAAAARAHVLAHHTHARVVEYILDTALDRLGRSPVARP
jgi:hypothetical protein